MKSKYLPHSYIWKKERSKMNVNGVAVTMEAIAKIAACIALLVAIVAAAVWLCRKLQQKKPKVSPEEEYDKLRREMTRLSDEMLTLIGGERGMINLKSEYEHRKSANPLRANDSLLSFHNKQERLKVAYAEYETLKKRICKLAKRTGAPVPTLQYEAEYIELINTELP